jgi:hypothetical protein
MIRHEVQVSSIRFYNTETDDPYAPYDAICSLTWESPSVIWIKGLHGELTRKTLRDLLGFLTTNNIQTVKAHRATGRTLPGLTVREGSFAEVSVSDLAKRFMK